MLIPTSLKGVIGRGGLLLQKHSPLILTIVGLGAMTGGAILAVKQTIKLEQTVDEAENRIKDVKQTAQYAEENPGEVEPWSEKEKQRALYKAYLRNALEFTKLYGPAISLFASGIVSVAVGHGLLQKRNVALVAAYNAVEKSFQAYRARVIEDMGEDKDRDYRLGITEVVEKGSDGKKVSHVEVDPTHMSKYARVFDEGNQYWQHEPGYNQFFLTQQQNYFNDYLLYRGHVFLNEVYDALGFPRTPEGQVVGWIVSDRGTDNYIDFGIYDASTQAKRNFVNGYERSIWLDFNVDGEILSKI